MDQSKLVQLLYQALAEATGQPVAPPAASPAVYPRLEVVHGVNMLLNAPLNPLYRPAMSAFIFGSGNHQVSDPSNGDQVGMPLRSPAGFPLVYAIGSDGSGKKIVVGTPSVYTEDHGFNSDAEVLQYIALTTKTAEQMEAERAQWAQVGAAIAAQQPAGPVDVPIKPD